MSAVDAVLCMQFSMHEAPAGAHLQCAYAKLVSTWFPQSLLQCLVLLVFHALKQCCLQDALLMQQCCNRQYLTYVLGLAGAACVATGAMQTRS
jgi:hypothetical protein